MKEERLLTVFGEIGEGYVEEAAPGRGGKARRTRRKWGVVAACLCLAAAAAFAALRPSAGTQERLLAAIETNGFSYDVLVETQLPVEGRIAVYEQVFPAGFHVRETQLPLDGGDALASFVGQPYLEEEERSWYRVEGMEELKYLISRDASGALRLWEFQSFLVLDGVLAWLRRSEASEQELAEAEAAILTRYPDADLSPYTYGDVYRMIFRVESGEDLACIIASPSDSNNTPLGKEIQKQVGTRRLKERDVIERFYDATVGVVCCGAGDFSFREDYRFAYSFSTDAANKLDSGEETWGSRYLRIVLRSGTSIDRWKYSALSGSFYEFGGIGTEPLPEETVNMLNEIFGIR